jgi:hypothetical protein
MHQLQKRTSIHLQLESEQMHLQFYLKRKATLLPLQKKKAVQREHSSISNDPMKMSTLLSPLSPTANSQDGISDYDVFKNS